jgi:hypothetical protein
MDNDNKIQSRKKFIGLSISAVALVTAFKFFIPKKKKKPGTVKMLSQNGELVEVDLASLPSAKKKITNKELQNWIKK